MPRFYWYFFRKTAANSQVCVLLASFQINPTTARRSSRQPHDGDRAVRFGTFTRAHLTRSVFLFLHLSAASSTAIAQALLQRTQAISERLQPHHGVIVTRPFRDLPLTL
jgi:hypothetical protein